MTDQAADAHSNFQKLVSVVKMATMFEEYFTED
jgi:hypothetical protein